ncbi:hypothetical protein GobsT_48430 [Gemmata obscuriglobus]|uniref:TIGR02996 domain-containing protein n=1 Tax=Gemmata obscuriglobus TaxID=114 RepID=UPI00016C47A8|nr:TIGR02996 domain-containing protein [Gemmata obscuriglobus]QEG30043.1 hypothetical protein GobsT_48430 [Gemmata obscuriglobus]VTS09364.1 unnamed protein product [Gemmata obscuriglobus UQM 2246]
MAEDEPFIRALLAAPDDRTARLVYADWLDDRSDPRAEYLRLSARLTELPLGSDERQTARERMLTLQHEFPSWWLAVVGYRAVPQASDRERIAKAASVLGRLVERTVNGRTVMTEAAAVSGLTGAGAVLESWSSWNNDDIEYCFQLNDRDGREASCELQIYDPDFPCGPEFLEWYGDTALLIYRGVRHGLYACRLGFDGAAAHRELALGYSPWVINGRELGIRRSHGDHIYRLSVPDLAELHPLSLVQAVARGLLPPS